MSGAGYNTVTRIAVQADMPIFMGRSSESGILWQVLLGSSTMGTIDVSGSPHLWLWV